MKPSTLKKLALIAVSLAGALGITTAQAGSASFAGSYSENFDSDLGPSGTTLPTGWTSMVISGGNTTYSASSPITTSGIASATSDTQTLILWNAKNSTATPTVDSGSQSFNIGCWDNTNSDRALGTCPTGTAAQVIQLSLVNNTSGTLNGVIFSYNCKCLTNGSVGTEETELPGYCFFYSTNGTTWTEDGVAGNAALVGGVPTQNGLCLPNFTEGTTMQSGPVVITFTTPLPIGGTMYFRWADDNNQANSPDQMLAIDDINISTYSATLPVVGITSPVNNQSFTPGANIAITANASEGSGTIASVAFYSGSTLLGTVTTPNAGTNYTYTWANVPVGNYALTAVATDSSGNHTTSFAVNIAVPSVPPSVSLTTPANNASFAAPASILLTATASDSTGTVTNVAFYQGSTLLANVTASPYTYTWANVPAGSYSLTAQAMDNHGSTGVSTAVSVTVTNSTVGTFTGSYSENFDSDLANSTTTLPTGFQAMYLPGSHFTYTNAPGQTIDSNAIVTAAIGSGASSLIVWNVGSAVTDASYQLFNIGCWDSLSDRALGTDPTGTGGTVIQLALTNNTGSPLSGVTFSYTEKCLTNGSTSNGSYTDDGTERLELPGYAFFYSIVGDTNPANWFNVVPLSLTNWVEGTQSNSGPVTLTFPTSLANGGVMYFRWADDNCVASSPDQMYAIDNISISALIGPAVSITSPANNSYYLVSAPIPITATASETGGTIASVAFYVNGSTLLQSFTSPPYSLTLPGYSVPAGSYVLTAVATDTQGNSTTSAPVNVTVSTTPVPVVSITSPANNANFSPGSSIPITASASESGGSIVSVAFYAGSTLLSTATSAPYTYSWPSVPAGHYALTAVATDALGTSVTSSVVNISVGAAYSPPTVSLTSPINYTVTNVPGNVTLSATATSATATITNVAFYQGSTLLGNVTTAPYNFTWSNPAANSYLITVVATDSTGTSTTSSIVNLTVVNTYAEQVLQQVKTIFVIPLENHDFTQANPTGSPEQLLGNPACPYFNSLITPGNSNAAQVSYATKYYSSAINGEHPSEPNYVWSEAGTDFGVRTDNDPSTGSGNLFSGVTHLSGQLTAAGISWKTYQEDVQYSSSAAVSASGTGSVNIYNGTTEYSYAVKHNPMEFFTDTQNKNYYPLAQFFTDLSNNAVARYNWITPDQYNEMHSSLPNGYTYHGTAFSGDQAAIAEGDNFLSIVIPQIMATAAYKNNGVIIIWTDETESTDDTGTTLPYVVISKLCRGNAYASPVVYSHSSDLKTMDEIFGLAFQTNAIPSAELNAQNSGYNYVFAANDISDMFYGLGIASSENPSGYKDNVTFTAVVANGSSPTGTVQFLTNGVAAGAPVVVAGGAASFSTTLLPPGTTLVTAQYSGDANNSPCTNSLSQSVTNHLPVAGTAYYARGNNISLKIAISDLLADVTDLSGYPITFVGVGTDGLNLLSTNGTTLSTNNAYVFYTNSVTPNVNDSFKYSVTDGQGDTALGSVVITMNNNLTGQTSPNLVIGTASVTASFFGVQGYRYAVDRSTNLTQGAGWVPISTNTAPAGGAFQVTDTFQDLGIPIPPLPPAVFYRLRYNP